MMMRRIGSSLRYMAILVVTAGVLFYLLFVISSIEVDGKRLATWPQVALTALFLLTGSIYTFDKRLLQWKRCGGAPPGEPMLPMWTSAISWLHYAVIIALFVTGWKYALFVLAAGFILAVLPVMETIGNALMAPFRPKNPATLTTVVGEALSHAHVEARAHLVKSVLSDMGDDLGELVVQNMGPYLAVLVAQYMTDLFNQRKVRVTGVRYDEVSVSRACHDGMIRAIEIQAQTPEQLECEKRRYVEYVEDYFDQFFLALRDPSHPGYRDGYFVACQQFCDRIAPIDSVQRRDALKVAGELRDIAGRSSFWAAGHYQVTGT